MDELVLTAAEALALLRELSMYVPRASAVVVEFSIVFDEIELLQVLNHERGKRLLEHLQAEFPELSRLKSWTGLRVQEITPALLEGIACHIKQRDFQGECEECRKRHTIEL